MWNWRLELEESDRRMPWKSYVMVVVEAVAEENEGRKRN